MPTLTLTPEEYETMLQTRREAEAENERLRHELVAARGLDGNEVITALTQLVRHAMPIISFAVANLPPETIRGWPTGDLARLADGLENLPDFAPADDELRLSWNDFVCDLRMLERQRTATSAQPVAQPTPNSVGD